MRRRSVVDGVDSDRGRGALRPVVDPARCEGKAACVAICPVGVFRIERIDADIFRGLPFLAKVKLWAHGMKTAATPHAQRCIACGSCVAVCPEGAIRLTAPGTQ
ncbi:MAG: 4Fe-4S binding protein [Azospirillum sp.]|nr:4Fe-4S binding protein [Azospirillum sp.]MCA3267916.1 4Fe-4S binding protein [Azospirillum sp.]